MNARPMPIGLLRARCPDGPLVPVLLQRQAASGTADPILVSATAGAPVESLGRLAIDAVIDDFNRNDEDPLSDRGHWSSGPVRTTDIGTLALLANRAHHSGVQLGDHSQYRTDRSPGPDLSVWATVAVMDNSSDHYFRLWGRVGNEGTANQTGYQLQVGWDAVNGFVYWLWRADSASSLTVIASASSQAVAGDKIELRCTGSSIQGLLNGTVVVSKQDATYKGSGRIALSCHITAVGNKSAVDDFGATHGAKASIPIESLQGVKQSSNAPIEPAGAVKQTGPFPIESLGGVKQTASEPLESLGSIRVTAGAPWESTAIAKALAGMPLEDLAGVVRSAGAAYEALGGIRATGLVPLESLQTLNITAGIPLENVAAAIALAGFPLEQLRGLAKSSGLPLETVNALLSSASVPVETQAGVRTLALLPWESVTAGGALTPILQAKVRLSDHALCVILLSDQALTRIRLDDRAEDNLTL